jgi:UrcA family protein
MLNRIKIPVLPLVFAVVVSTSASGSERVPIVYGKMAEPIERGERPDGTRTARVSLKDLDLANAAGEVTLNKRIRIAVIYVCNGPLPDDYFASGSNGGRRVCISKTRESVQPKVDAAIASARNGERLAVTSIGFKSR